MPVPHFTRTVIGALDNSEHTTMNTFVTTGDINGDRLTDVIVGGRSGTMAWFENPGSAADNWKRHDVSPVRNQECGGMTFDLTGSGFPDIIDGGDWQSDELSWWENPGPNGAQWTRYVIAKTGHTQFHDERIGDVTGDGRLSLIFWNQGNGSLYWSPLPQDPRISPWPEVRLIASDMREGNQPEEGIAIGDIDGDGKNEIVAGQHWYKYLGEPDKEWEIHKFADGYISTLAAIADLDGDGKNEVLLSEGDACIYGKPQGGKFAWFKPGGDTRQRWEEHVVEDYLLDPHSLQLGDLCGNGRVDVLLGEIGVKETIHEKPPRLMVYENDGKANFTRHVIDEGTGSHHARLVDLLNTGRLDIVSRPLHGDHKWNVYVWYNDGFREE